MKKCISLIFISVFWAVIASGQHSASTSRTTAFRVAISEVDGAMGNVKQSGLFPPGNLQAVVNGNSVLLTWSPPDSSAGITGYNVYKNGFRITSFPTTSLSYNDIGLNQGTYTYRVSSVYDSLESPLSDTVQALIPGFVTIGTGITAVGYPYYTFYMGSRTQMLYTAAELTAAGALAGNLFSIGFNVGTAYPQVMSNFTIKMGLTASSTLTGFVTTGMSTVYQVNYGVPGTGWKDITLTAPFAWNGNSNIIVEICFGDNGSYTSNSMVMGTAAVNQTWHYHADNYAGCTGTSAGAAQATRPNIRFGVAPVVTGTIIGVVKDAIDFSVIPNAIVNIGNQVDTTDMNGYYQLFGIPEGVDTIAAVRVLYATVTDTVVCIGNGATNKDILMLPGPRLAGIVTNAASGAPLAGATISVAGVSAQSGAGGYYITPSMTVVGLQEVTITSPTFDTLTDVVFLTANDTIAFDAALLPTTYPPGTFTATLNVPISPVAVNLSWEVPVPDKAVYGDAIQDQALSGAIDYQVWRLQQGQETNENLWTSIAVVDTNLTVDNDWPVLPNAPYRWAVKAIYGPGQRFSEVSISNVLGKNWTAKVDVCVTLSCVFNSHEGTTITLTNIDYPDTNYVLSTDTAGCVHFLEVWKGNYQLKVSRFLYLTYTQTLSVLELQSIQVSLNEDLIPVSNLVVDDSSLFATWSPPTTNVFQLNEPFTNLTANQWEISGGTNWQLSAGIGNPAPSVMFNWSPRVSSYDQYLTSKSLAGLHAPAQTLKYDIYLDNFGTTYLNSMAVEIWDGVNWTALKTYVNSSDDFPWTSESLDISSATDLSSFKIRFHAFGTDSYDLNSWNIDNVQVISSNGAGTINPCVIGYNFYLNGGLATTTTDSLFQIPPALVQYGQLYNACVEALYQNGPSPLVCAQFVSKYLYPPRNLAGTSSINSTYLTWIPPLTGAGVIGYNVYRNDRRLNTAPVTALYYIDEGVPVGTYNYIVTAIYDLTFYGSPGQFGESGPAGPVSINITGQPAAPVTTAGNAGTPNNSTVLVPVTTNGFANISAFTLRLEYDPMELTYTGIANIAPELAGLMATASYGSPGLNKIILDWSNLNPQTLLPNGKIADLRFVYHSGTSSLAWNNTSNGGADCSYFDAFGNPMPDIPTSAFYIDGNAHWEQGYMISGNYNYNNAANTPLNNLKVMLKKGDSKIDSVSTNASGHFIFNNIVNGSYQLKAYTTKPWEGVNSTDALKIQRHFVGLEIITEPVRKLAADVNNTGSVNSTDALKVKRRFIGLDSGFPRGDWAFVKPTIGGDTVVVNNSDVVQDFYGLCVGDVNASNIPGPGKSVISTVTLLHDGIMEVNGGKEAEVPVFIKTSTEIGAISIVLKYPSTMVKILNVEALHGELMFEETGNEVRIAWSEINPMKVGAEEAFMKLRLRVNENVQEGQEILFDITNACEISDGLGFPVFPATLSMPVMKVAGAGNDADDILSNVVLFPNPANEWASISYSLGGPAKVTMEFYSPYGQILGIKDASQSQAGNYQQNFDVSAFPSGLYLIKIKTTFRHEEYIKTMRMAIRK